MSVLPSIAEIRPRNTMALTYTIGTGSIFAVGGGLVSANLNGPQAGAAMVVAVAGLVTALGGLVTAIGRQLVDVYRIWQEDRKDARRVRLERREYVDPTPDREGERLSEALAKIQEYQKRIDDQHYLIMKMALSDPTLPDLAYRHAAGGHEQNHDRGYLLDRSDEEVKLLHEILSRKNGQEHPVERDGEKKEEPPK